MVSLNGTPLDIASIVAVARQDAKVEIATKAREAMTESAAVVAKIGESGSVVYGVTTGFGALADHSIAPQDRRTLQRALLLSHAAGIGDPLPREVVRAMLLLRARTLCTGLCGVRPEIALALLELLNRDITPWVPMHGSLGASGDLAPLAHAACVLIGEGYVQTDDGKVATAKVLEKAELQPLQLEPKEGLALINGTDAMCAVLALALHDLSDLLVLADCVAAMSIEALLGTTATLLPEVVDLRKSPGQKVAAANLRNLLQDSSIVASHRDSHHAVQDAYSLRCTPQVHGAARDLTEFCQTTLQRELSSVVDNPVVFAESERVLSTGNFHGQALAYGADCMAMVCADMAAISERRTDRLLDPSRSRGLSPFLAEDSGRNSGLMMAQYPAAALVASLRAAAIPISVLSASTSAGQEDHVSMGFEAVWRTRESVEKLRYVLAVELICAAQALDLRAPLQPAPATGKLRDGLRKVVDKWEQDRFLADDLAAASAWIANGGWRNAITKVSLQ